MKFIRRNWDKYSRLGKKRKKKQTWRRAKGRHNKVREKRKGYPIKVMIGFRKKKEERNLIEKKKLVVVNNLRELEKVQKGEMAIVGKVGEKKKIEIAKKAKEKGIQIYNLNINKMIKKVEKKRQKTESEKIKNKTEEKK